MFKRDPFLVLFAALALLIAGSARAGGGGFTGGATEWTQIQNNLQLVKVAVDQAKTAQTVVDQYMTQLQQYQMQVANLAKLPQLPPGLTGDAATAYDSLLNYRNALTTLQGSLGQQQQAIEQRVMEARLSGQNWGDYVNSVAADAASKKQRAVQRLQYEDSVLQQVQSDYTFARNLQDQIPATVGQHQALQLMNAQMNRVVTQNAKLLEVVSSNLQQQSDKDAADAEAMTRALSQQELLRQRQDAITQRQRAFGGLPQ